MGIRSFNAIILKEAREVTGNKNLKKRDIQEWSTGKTTCNENEREIRLTKLGLNVVILKEK